MVLGDFDENNVWWFWWGWCLMILMREWWLMILMPCNNDCFWWECVLCDYEKRLLFTYMMTITMIWWESLCDNNANDQDFCSMLGLKALWCLCYYNITRWIDIFDENILCDAENDDSWFDENDALCDDMKKRWLIRMFAWWQCK